MRKIFILPVAAITLLLSCKKEKVCTYNAASLVGSYKITGANIVTAGQTVDLFTSGFYMPCQKDDYFFFYANGNYSFVDAGTVCNPIRDDRGTYTIMNDYLILDGTFPIQVKDFTCNGFKMVTKSISGGVESTTTTILTKK